MKRLFLASVALMAPASFATAQTQRVPTAIDPGGRPENSQPAAIMIAPAGGVSGPGTVVAPDHPLPVVGSFTIPTGASTAANQVTGNTSLGSIDTKLSSQATAAKQDTANTWLSNIQTNTTGISTAAKQDTGNTSLGSIDTKLSSQATAANQTAPQATPGSDASKAMAVQGVTGGKPVATNGGTPAFLASGVTPVTAALTSATCTSAFVPAAGRGFNISGWGTFVASYQLSRSFDGGTTKLPITAAGTPLYQWTGPASEQAQEPEFGVSYYVCAITYTSGTLNIRISQ